MKTFISGLSGKRFPLDERIAGSAVRTSLMDMILKDNPGFDTSKYLALSELNIYRERYISKYLEKEVGDMTELDNKVLDAVTDKSMITSEMIDVEERYTVGQRVADKVASFGGSWRFILIFLGFIVAWICLNLFWLSNRDLDPYPFILLNLMLSCLSALQAPIIMMSQNRQADKDRTKAENDYMVNLKSELEVRGLHEKLDHLMLYQQQELIEIQKIQIDMLTDIQKHLEQRIKPSSAPAAASKRPPKKPTAKDGAKTAAEKNRKGRDLSEK